MQDAATVLTTGTAHPRGYVLINSGAVCRRLEMWLPLSDIEMVGNNPNLPHGVAMVNHIAFTQVDG